MNIIIQAGGKGTRLRYKGWNKPKCLMTVDGKPLMYHLFEKYPESNFYIIGDYKFDILEKYLRINPPEVNFKLYKTTEKGTCSGVLNVIHDIDNDNPVVVTWGDILYRKKIEFNGKSSVIYKTSCYSSRYKCYESKIVKEKTSTDGIAGIFYFPNKKYLFDVPPSGSFMTWTKNNTNYVIKECKGIDEVGDYDHYIKLAYEGTKFRFFNCLKFTEKTVEKKCIIDKYNYLIKNEQNWYAFMKKHGFKNIPNVLSLKPYIIERIEGIHPFESDIENLEEIMENIFLKIKEMHSLSVIDADINELYSVYVKKTINRLESVYELLPFQNKEYITINGLKCKNVFFNKDFSIIKEIFLKLGVTKFHSIHGDTSASNIIIKNDMTPVFIDPRGYFYDKFIHGDKFYDYAKLYFSMVTGYDIYNRKNFILYYDDDSAEILIENKEISLASEKIFSKYFSNDEIQKIKLINCLIWFGMSGYAIDDVDSIIAANLIGLYNLEKTIGRTNE